MDSDQSDVKKGLSHVLALYEPLHASQALVLLTMEQHCEAQAEALIAIGQPDVAHAVMPSQRPPFVQGYLAHKKATPL